MPSLFICPRNILGAAIGIAVNLVYAEPGDLIREIVVNTNDSLELTEITRASTFIGGGVFPVSIDDRGIVTFTAKTFVNNEAGTGIFQYRNSLNSIAESGDFAPGVTNNGDPILMTTVPTYAYTTSPDGVFHAFTSSAFSGGYLYAASDDGIFEPPITHQFRSSNNIQPNGLFEISDGRETVKSIGFGGAVGSMVVSDSGVLAWKYENDLFKATINPIGASSVSAIAFLNSPANGFEIEANAKIVNPLDLRGVDNEGNTYFVSGVTGSGLFDTAVYQVDEDASGLSLLFAPTVHPLPGLSPETSPRLDRLDVFPLEDGTVVLRIGTPSSSISGFWKIDPEGEISLIKLFEETNPTATDSGPLGFRSLRADLAVFSVADDGTVFFTADVRDGVANVNQEGVWAIDPTDQSIKTIARSGEGAPETNANYGVFSHISAAGDGFVAFISTLSDGNRGLFATNNEGEVVKIAIEGQPVLDDQSILGGNIKTIYFTADHAGEDLDISQGAAGINDQGGVAFTADLVDGGMVVVRATFEREFEPVGDDYIWDGGAGTGDWHTVANGRSNWVDAFGTPWPEPPGGGSGNEEVLIGPEVTVQLNADISIYELDLNGSTLVVKADLSFRNLLKVRPLGQLRIHSGAIQSSEGAIEVEGKIVKRSPESFQLKVVEMALVDSELSMEEGTLLVENGESRFTTSLLSQTGGVMTLNDTSTRFQGESASVSVSGGPLNLISKSISIESDTVLNTSETGVIQLGSELPDAEFKLVGGSSGNKRTLKFIGNGEVEIRVPFNIPLDAEVLIDNSETLSLEGVKFNLPTGKRINAFGNLINTGLMTLQRGGLLDQIHNNGLFFVKAADPADKLILSCVNNDRIEQYSDIGYSMKFDNTRNSSFHMYGGALTPESPESDILKFEKRMRFSVKQGNNEIQFPTTESSRLSTSINIEGSASLEVSNSRMTEEVTISVESEDGSVMLENTEFERLVLDGEGEASIRGKLKARLVGPSRPDLKFDLRTKSFRFVTVELSADVSSDFCLGDKSQTNAAPSKVTGTFDGAVVAGNKVFLRLNPSASLTIRSPISLEGKFLVVGKLILRSSILKSSPASLPIIFFGSSEIGGYSSGIISIPEGLDEPVIIAPDIVLAGGGRNKFTVDDNSHVIFQGEFEDTDSNDASGNVPEGQLPVGQWNIGNGSSFLIMAEGETLETIDPIVKIEGSLIVGIAPEGFPSLNGLSSRDIDLDILPGGRLTMVDARLEFISGKGVYNQGELTLTRSRIIGTVENSFLYDSNGNLRGGKFNIGNESFVTGEVINDGELSTGSSPGTGMVEGDLTLGETSRYHVEFAGEEAGAQYDRLDVTGTANLHGELVLYFLDGYEPTGGEQFEFLKAPTITGDFAEVDQSRLGRDVRFDFAVGSTGMMATAMEITIASYSDWREAFFTAPDAADNDVSGIGKDPDGDRFTNLAEYALGGNPNVLEPDLIEYAIQDSATPEENLTSISFNWVNDVDDATWSIESSSDLENWVALDSGEITMEPNGDYTRITGTQLRPTSPGEDLFLRVQIVEAP